MDCWIGLEIGPEGRTSGGPVGWGNEPCQALDDSRQIGRSQTIAALDPEDIGVDEDGKGVPDGTAELGRVLGAAADEQPEITRARTDMPVIARIAA